MTSEYSYKNFNECLNKIFSQDNKNIELQLCYSGVYMMIYEHIKYMLTKRINAFFSATSCDDYTINQDKKSKQYIDECSRAGGVYEFGFSFYELTEEQKNIIREAQHRRSKATHQFLDLFLSKEHFSFLELKQLYTIAKYIDNYWIINLEIIDNIDIKNTDLENAHSAYFLLITQVLQKIFPLEVATKKNH